MVAIKSLKLEPQRLVKFLELAMLLAQACIYEMSNQKGIFYKSMNLIQERNKGRGKERKKETERGEERECGERERTRDNGFILLHMRLCFPAPVILKRGYGQNTRRCPGALGGSSARRARHFLAALAGVI